MVAPNHKLASETKQWPCVHRGKGLPMLAYFWVNGKGQLVLLTNHRVLCDHVGYDILQNGDLQRQKGVE